MKAPEEKRTSVIYEEEPNDSVDKVSQKLSTRSILKYTMKQFPNQKGFWGVSLPVSIPSPPPFPLRFASIVSEGFCSMVLSNKKLKQRIRAQLAESLAKSESQANKSDLNDSQTHQSIKSLLNSATQKPKLSKREKRRVNIPSLQGTSELQNHENGVEERESEEGNGGLKKNKKRKREKDGVEVKDVDNEVKDLSEKNISKKKKKKKKKNKKKKVVKKEEEGLQKANGGSEEIVVAEAVQTYTSNEDGISTKVYVGGIPYYSTVDDIQSYFEGCGSITEIDRLKFPETGKFNGIAMISFRTDAAAKRALALDGSDMGGLLLKVQPYKQIRDKKVSDFAPAMLEGYNRIYVGNLSWDTTEDELKKLFSDCRISSIRLGKDKETGEFRGFAHVDFADSLSLTMALKLDQKLLFGRPVRIRCAVPPKSVNPSSKLEPAVGENEANVFNAPVGVTSDTVVNDDVARKAKRQTCYECGHKGHLSSSCMNRKAANVAHTGYETNDVAFDITNTLASMLRRRTCYECGERGHLSSLCPKKQATDVANMSKESIGMEIEKFEEPKTIAAVGNEAGGNLVSNVSDGKLRRRTCYECGERGHLSSLCPKKQGADVANMSKEANGMEVEKSEEPKTMAAVGNVSDGKLRRRTCYECGERGHLSSLCPKKQAADLMSSSKEAINGMEIEKAEELKPVEAVGNEAGNNVVSSVSGGKIRRRTCYECGEKGHLSSMCPNIKADFMKP
ncbi:Nucleotide-binding, alpha-beta plait, partial [Cynara cardunculus var. scolymus]